MRGVPDENTMVWNMDPLRLSHAPRVSACCEMIRVIRSYHGVVFPDVARQWLAIIPCWFEHLVGVLSLMLGLVLHYQDLLDPVTRVKYVW